MTDPDLVPATGSARPFEHLSTGSTFADIVNHPAFAGFGDYMVPWESGETAEITRPLTVEALAPHLGAWDPRTMVDGLNFLIDLVNQGRTIFHPLYSEGEIAAEPDKAAAGLFFVPGVPGRPLALVAAGGGFTSVASIQEGFPHAKALNALGYNVAVLKYRISKDGNDENDDKSVPLARANEDLARAMSLLAERAVAWDIGLDDYSVWGSSAGGRLVSSWGTDGPLGARAHGFHPPAVIITAYPGTPFGPYSASFPPYFVTVAADDELISVAALDHLVDDLRSQGVDVEYRRTDAGGHGYGLGTGTPADGWLGHAVAFWRSHSTAG
ncbi:alpha/beta hydrolase [Streptomyces sp. NPDC058457]|uniref:alpha/beta hydrolase n=1 Tax=Streptomyces sp. NPDC058457 TaxID=3346507 RepID=UPI003654839F